MLVAGSTIDQRYRLVALIGEGGMASVWHAEDYNLKRDVAIKLLYLPPQRDSSLANEQFLREARIAAAVQHRNVIHTMDFGTTSEGVPYMVMELLHGETLAERMQRDPLLRVDEWIRIIEMTLRGLAAVHEAGIIHRDLKPQNIFLQRDADGVYPKILDFGISRSSDSQQLASPIATQAGFVLGTPHYMSPEQAAGDVNVDHRADIYSVATILYEGLSGRLPFDADTTADLLRKIISSEPTPLRELCSEGAELICDCISQAMSRKRDERFGDARAFRTALTRAYELSYPTSVSVNRSALPIAPVPKLAPQNDVGRPAWGDFEGLGERRKDVSVPLAAARRDVSGPLPRRDVSAPVNVARERKDVSVPLARERKEPSGPLTGSRERKDVSVPLARERKDVSMPVSGRKDVSMPVSGRKDASAPLYAPGEPLPAAGEQPVPQPRPRPQAKSQPEPPPDAALSYPGEGPLLGDNPLDAFAGSAAVALELDFAPWQERRPEDAELKEKKPVQQVVPVVPQARVPTGGDAQAQRAAAASARRDLSGLWWLLPFALLVLFCVFLLLPGLFSLAPPDPSAARAREAEAPATRGSTRMLKREKRELSPAARPERRELLE
jgi:serine/threonine protein kinase